MLGQAGTPGHCGPPSPYICTSLAGTSDGGKTWHGVTAPVTGAPKGPSGVSQIRFYNTSDGWAFGPQLWATHNGGRSWKQISTGGLRVTALETAGQRVFAVWARCSGTGASWAAGCTGQALYSAAPGGNRWAPVPGAAASLQPQRDRQRGRAGAHRQPWLPAAAERRAGVRAGQRRGRPAGSR